MWPRSNLHSRPEISGDPYKTAKMHTNVRYPEQFGEHIPTQSFTARDPIRTVDFGPDASILEPISASFAILLPLN